MSEAVPDAVRSLSVDRSDPAPPYEQLERRLAALVEDGALRPGDRLPTVRRLAEDLGLAPNTVARVYRDLEARGLLDTRGRSGTFVAGDRVQQEAGRAAAEYVARVRALGLDPATALELVRRGLGGP